jgi:hypothetical protein
MQFSLEKLNRILTNLHYPSEDVLEYVQKDEIHMGVSGSSYGDDGVQGESDNYAKIYKIVGEDDLYLKVEFETDSYGSNDGVVGVQFVRPIKKTIIGFEPVK